MAEPSLTPLPPRDAIAYFRSKGLTPSFAWQDVWQEEHARAFAVAKMANLELLEITRQAVDQALADGQTFEQFKAGLKPHLQAAGWWGRQEMTDPLTGETKMVQLGSDRRLRTIFDMNVRTARAHGNWQRIERSKRAFPYLMYIAVGGRSGDGRTRLQHREWHGTCLPVDDPWWDTHYPPCGWNCRCATQSLTRRMMETRGLKISKPVQFEPVTYVHPRTGEVTQIERGIDPGFNYNVGKAPLRPLSPAPALVRPGRPSVPAAEAKTASTAFLNVFDADGQGRIVQDRDGWPLAVTDGLFRDPRGYAVVPRPDLIDDLPEVAQALKKPDHAEWVWARDMRSEAEVTVAIDRVVDAALSGEKKERFITGPVSAPFVTLARKHGLDLSGFEHELTADAVRHVRNNHYDSVAETQRGQIAMSRTDFLELPGIVAAPDAVIFGKLDVVFVARRASGVYVYVTNIKRREKGLESNTFYKKPVLQNVQSVASAALPNVRNEAGFPPKIVDLTGDNKAWRNYSRQQLVRRYTKTLDDRRITVDFSRDHWTYDIQPLPERP